MAKGIGSVEHKELDFSLVSFAKNNLPLIPSYSPVVFHLFLKMNMELKGHRVNTVVIQSESQNVLLFVYGKQLPRLDSKSRTDVLLQKVTISKETILKLR